MRNPPHVLCGAVGARRPLYLGPLLPAALRIHAARRIGCGVCTARQPLPSIGPPDTQSPFRGISSYLAFSYSRIASSSWSVKSKRGGMMLSGTLRGLCCRINSAKQCVVPFVPSHAHKQPVSLPHTRQNVHAPLRLYAPRNFSITFNVRPSIERGGDSNSHGDRRSPSPRTRESVRVTRFSSLRSAIELTPHLDDEHR